MTLEKKISDNWIEDFDKFTKKQWKDFDYKLPFGESLSEVQKRNINSIEDILEKNENRNTVISGHGTSLSTIINFYDKYFTYDEFEKIKNLMPFIVCFNFNKKNIIKIEKIVLQRGKIIQ